jgi:hypothetical protein
VNVRVDTLEIGQQLAEFRFEGVHRRVHEAVPPVLNECLRRSRPDSSKVPAS